MGHQAKGFEEQIEELGLKIFEGSDASTTLFRKNAFSDFLMNFALDRPELKVQLFRFVDVLPTLKTNKQIADFFREYLLYSDVRLPLSVNLGLLFGFKNEISARLLAPVVKQNVVAMAKGFITGSDSQSATKSLKSLWESGSAFTVDILGEAAVNFSESRSYRDRYIELIHGLSKKAKS